ncbi:unnamed protein product [Blepharisma stoltei]|uniref:Uncharacterized protein n=1 Tax=Blepharisma stoltei TaxID=1481888 RepID=A0AAU9JVQ0_9CILI|nr:unnamed protein product [Blepharisma stoltei]
MNADSFFIYTSTLEGIPIWVISHWYQHPCIYDPNLPLCKLWILINQSMFHAPVDIFTSSCNAQLISADYFTTLRDAFKAASHNIRFFFREDKDDNSAELELHMPMDGNAKLFVSMFKTRLEKNFKGEFINDFLFQVLEVVRFKNEIIDRQNKKIEDLAGLSVEVDTARVEVGKLKEETGPSLAAQFIGILNDLKSSKLTQKTEVKEEDELGSSLLSDLNKN